MHGYNKPTKGDFNPNHYIFDAGTNYLWKLWSPWWPKSLKSDQNTVTISTIVPRDYNFIEKFTKVNKLLTLKCCEKGIPLILHDKINPKRHLNKSRLHFKNYGNATFVRNLKQFFDSCP